MNDRLLVEEWSALRRRSLRLLPVAVILAVVLGMLVYLEGLYLSEAGFLAGLLVGVLVYWAVLEAVTFLRIGRLLRTATRSNLSR